MLGTTNDSFLAVSGSLTLNPDVSLAISAGASNWATGKTFVLAVAAGDITDSSSSFTGWSISGTGLGSHLYTLSIVGSNSLDLTVNAGPTNHSWSTTQGGSWATAGNWSGGIPTNYADMATFGAGIGNTAATVTMDGSHTLSALSLKTTCAGAIRSTPAPAAARSRSTPASRRSH